LLCAQAFGENAYRATGVCVCRLCATHRAEVSIENLTHRPPAVSTWDEPGAEGAGLLAVSRTAYHSPALTDYAFDCRREPGAALAVIVGGIGDLTSRPRLPLSTRPAAPATPLAGVRCPSIAIQRCCCENLRRASQAAPFPSLFLQCASPWVTSDLLQRKAPLPCCSCCCLPVFTLCFWLLFCCEKLGDLAYLTMHNIAAIIAFVTRLLFFPIVLLR